MLPRGMADTTMHVETLRKIPLFAELSDATLERIIALGTEADIAPGQVLIETGQGGAGLFIIEDGAVVVSSHGKTFELGPGSCVGELALLTPNATRTARVQAKTAARVLAIARGDFERLLHEEPPVAVAMLRVVAERLADAMS